MSNRDSSKPSPIVVFDTCSLQLLTAPVGQSRYVAHALSRDLTWLDIIPPFAAGSTVERVVIPNVVVFEAIGKIGGVLIDRQRLDKSLKKGEDYRVLNKFLSAAGYRSADGKTTGGAEGLEVREVSYKPYVDLKAFIESDPRGGIWGRVADFRKNDHGEKAVQQFLTKDLKHVGDVFFISEDRGARQMLGGKTTSNGQRIIALPVMNFIKAVLQDVELKESLGINRGISYTAAKKDLDIYDSAHHGQNRRSALFNDARSLDNLVQNALRGRTAPEVVEPDENRQAEKFVERYGKGPAARRAKPRLSDVPDEKPPPQWPRRH